MAKTWAWDFGRRSDDSLNEAVALAAKSSRQEHLQWRRADRWPPKLRFEGWRKAVQWRQADR
jgi:hypothetical protein